MTRYYSTHPGPLPLEDGTVLAMGERTPDTYPEPEKLAGTDAAHLEAGRLVVDDYEPEPAATPAARTKNRTKGASDE